MCVITAINSVRLELDASIFKNANFLVNVMVLGMRIEFRRGSLLKNFIWNKTGRIQTDNITTDFREMTCEDGSEGNQRYQVRLGLSFVITELN
jgi:hypothetical protein